jgi:monoamine oxidase
MKRRDFLKSGLVLAAGTSLAPGYSFSTLRKPEVLILGAGLAGLGAAYQCKKNGVSFTILEAQSRIGGRVFTHSISEEDGLTVELGGEWIGASHNVMQDLCQEFGLKLMDHTYDTALLMRGKYSKAGDWAFGSAYEKYEAALEQARNFTVAEEKKIDKLDWWRYLRKMGLDERDIELRELLDSTDFGETIRNVSAYAALSEYAWSSPKNEMDLWVEGGNSQIIEKLADFAGRDHIHTGHKVSEVVQSGGKVRVVCSNGKSFTADKVVCTLPTNAISQIRWEPGLPPEKQDALDALQYCRIMKTHVLFKERFWKMENFDMITDTPAHYFFHCTKLQKSGKGVLTSYTTGDKAYLFSRMNKEQKIRAVCDALEVPFGKVDEYVDKVVSYYWGNDPYTMGAYAIYDTDQWFTLLPALQKHYKHIHFAGEHVAEWQGFMEGAVITGFEAVSEFL